MPSGIYSLFWEEQDLVYVGQAQILKRRKAEHLRKLRSSTHTNYKVQNAYNMYGEPQFIILEECDIFSLNDREQFWQVELNSLSSLDIIYAGQVGYGTKSNSSKYSTYTVLKVFICLYSRKYRSHKDIAKRCQVPSELVSDIYTGSTHLWLKTSYSEYYKIMQSIDYKSMAHWGTTKKQVPYPILVSPEGLEVQVLESILNTARDLQTAFYPEDSEEVIRKGISRVLSGKRATWRKWTLK